MLRRRHLPLGALVSLLALVAPAAAQGPAPAPAPEPEPRVQPGVSAGGVDLSNLTLAEATAKLDGELTTHLKRDLVFDAAGRTFRLTAVTGKFAFDADLTARRALKAGGAPPPQEGGAVVGTEVPLAFDHSSLATRKFAARVRDAISRAPRNATIRITLRRVRTKRSRPGISLDTERAVKAVNAALKNPLGSRRLHQRVKEVRAAVNTLDLARIYRTVITIDKSNFTLRLFKDFRVSKRYGVAIGQPAYPTPSGTFSIQSKQVDPVWSVPNSPWAGELQGTTVAGGSAANPLKARWMGIVNGVGIHGTGEEGSIGSRASHGCIRMRVADVKNLYPRVPVGTTVLIK